MSKRTDYCPRCGEEDYPDVHVCKPPEVRELEKAEALLRECAVSLALMTRIAKAYSSFNATQKEQCHIATTLLTRIEEALR